MTSEARDRRTYRLALLLTGRADAAALVAADVAESAASRRHRRRHRRPGQAGAPDRTDRLTVLASRRRLESAAPPARAGHRSSAGAIIPSGPGAGVAEALASVATLTAQAREAWIFVRVFGHSLREAAIAMDCSRSAVRRHLRRGDAQAAIAGGAHPSEVDTPESDATDTESMPAVAAGRANDAPPPAPHAANAALIDRVRQAMVGATVPEAVLADAARAAARPGRRRLVGILVLLVVGAGLILAAVLGGRWAIDQILALVAGADAAGADASGTGP